MLLITRVLRYDKWLYNTLTRSIHPWMEIKFSLFLFDNNVWPRCRNLFDTRMFNTCQSIIDHVRERRSWIKCLILFRDSPKLNRVDFDSYGNTIFDAFADQAFNKLCLRLPWNSAVEFPYDSCFFFFFFIYLSIYFFSPQLLVISSSQSKRDERFFQLEIFLSIAINVAGESRNISHFNIGEITVSFLLCRPIFCGDRSSKNHMNNSKFTTFLRSNSCIYEYILC